MPLTQIQPGSYEAASINTTDLGANVTATYATYAAVAANLTPRITTVNVANSSYTVLDDTSLNTSGGFLVITGANFQSGAIVTIDTTNATSTTFINSTTLRAQTASKTAGSYNLYVTNPDGGTAIKVLGVSYSNTPIWGTAATLSNQAANTAFAVNISANSDSNVTYSNTTSLPAGTTLLANGLFYGTVTIGAETVYTFTVNAIDAELQDTPRTFSLTVTVGPPPFSFYSWGGSGSHGEFGLNDIDVKRSSPVQVGSNFDWKQIRIHQGNSAGIKSDGTLWTWGYNLYGQLGKNDGVDRSSPVQVGSSTNWSMVSIAPYHGVAIKTDGTIWSWGNNAQGQLGQGNLTLRSSPTQIGSSTNWSIVECSWNNTYTIKTDGTLWAWGYNSNGALGNNSTANMSSPIQIGSNTTWSKLGSGLYKGFALKTDNTLWAWGWGLLGALGLGDQNDKSSPTQIAGTTWSSISDDGAAIFNCAAIKTDGTLWTWGSDSNGQLGLGSTGTYRSSPVQVGSNTTWSLINMGGYSAVAIKTDKSAWVWGKNSNGELGLNTTSASVASPVQLGSDLKWSYIQICTQGSAGGKIQ